MGSLEEIRQIDFKIPNSVRRSLTADVVNNGDFIQDQKCDEFLKLRNHFGKYFSLLREALNEFNLLDTRNIINKNSYNYRLNQLVEKSQICEKALQKMADVCGIWNCGEFAYFALIKIVQSGILNKGFHARLVSMNDMRIPEVGGINHDHIFVIIRDRENREFAIDLWQTFVTDEAYIGTHKDFIRFLNDHMDGQYVVRRTDDSHYYDRLNPQDTTNRKDFNDTMNDRIQERYYQGIGIQQQDFPSPPLRQNSYGNF